MTDAVPTYTPRRIRARSSYRLPRLSLFHAPVEAGSSTGVMGGYPAPAPRCPYADGPLPDSSAGISRPPASAAPLYAGGGTSTPSNGAFFCSTLVAAAAAAAAAAAVVLCRERIQKRRMAHAQTSTRQPKTPPMMAGVLLGLLPPPPPPPPSLLLSLLLLLLLLLLLGEVGSEAGGALVSLATVPVGLVWGSRVAIDGAAVSETAR
ncbi:hypothetical protein L209DRAFT_284391 [Thermothelomyces heterothallicus CBS 203.75]